MRRAFLSLAAALMLGTAPIALSTAQAQGLAQSSSQEVPASLVADSVFIDADGRLTASGGVEVFHDTTRLKASKIVYDPDGQRLKIEGPITVTEATGNTIILASQADLSTDMTEGILTGARLVLDRQLQIAADSLSRTGGRYNRATRVRASACEVCASNPTPLWEIRATRVVHDEEAQQLYFDNAQFRVVGIPVFWSPMLRLPDPTLKRSAGFLLPSIRSTSQLGTGIKLPYFVPIGDHADVTLTPYISTNQTRTLDLRYRQAFSRGQIEFNGAVSHDDLDEGDQRGYLFGEGSFFLPRDFVLNFGLEMVSDDAYLSDYGLDDKDRLESYLEVTRTRRNEYISGRLTSFHTTRDTEDNETMPTLLGDFTLHRRFAPAVIGGEGGLEFNLNSYKRKSAIDFDENGDGITDGRDATRATVTADWRRNWVMANGMIFSGLGQLVGQSYLIEQDEDYQSTINRAIPTVGVELRWPFMRQPAAPNTASWVIEPVAQLAWSPDHITRVPNEDSQLVEFDEGNLFSLDRFPGEDDYEAGLRANLGVAVTRQGVDGSTINFTLGRVLREKDLDQYSSSTGLDGQTSDWLLFAQYSADNGIALTNRAIFDDALSVARDELRLSLDTERYSIASGFNWLEADPYEGRDDSTSEFTLDADWQFRDQWRAMVKGRYDFEAERANRAGVGLSYQTECARFDVSLSRRYTSSTSVSPDTAFSLSVVLAGFGAKNSTGMAQRSCSG